MFNYSFHIFVNVIFYCDNLRIILSSVREEKSKLRLHDIIIIVLFDIHFNVVMFKVVIISTTTDNFLLFHFMMSKTIAVKKY